MIRSSQCRSCAHLIADTRTCAAFPDGVPSGAWTGRLDHRAPIEGDNGVRFAQRADRPAYWGDAPASRER